MAEICTPPVKRTDPDGTEWVSFNSHHSLQDIARWLMENPVDASELHTILGDMLWDHGDSLGVTETTV